MNFVNDFITQFEKYDEKNKTMIEKEINTYFDKIKKNKINEKIKYHIDEFVREQIKMALECDVIVEKKLNLNKMNKIKKKLCDELKNYEINYDYKKLNRHIVLKIGIEFENFYYYYDYDGAVGLDTEQNKEHGILFSDKTDENIKLCVDIMFKDEYFVEQNLIYKMIDVFEDYCKAI